MSKIYCSARRKLQKEYLNSFQDVLELSMNILSVVIIGAKIYHYTLCIHLNIELKFAVQVYMQSLHI